MTDKEILSNYGLETNENLTTIGFESEEDWHKLRTKGIGGSDIGAILGLNKYSSPLKIYKAKVEGVSSSADNVFTRKGKDLEALIRAVYVAPVLRKEGYTVKTVPYMLVNNMFPYLRANIDGIAVKDVYTSHEDQIIIEIKWVSQWAECNWNGDEYLGVPPSYYAQVQEYMAVTGTKRAKICALFDSTWEVKIYDIPRDDRFINNLLAEAKTFYFYNMTMKIPPKFTPGLDSTEIVEKLREIKEDPIPTYVDVDLDESAVKYKEVNLQIKALEKTKADLQADIINRYIKGARPMSEGIKVKVSDITSSRFDSARFGAEHPDLYKQYLKETDSTRLTVK